MADWRVCKRAGKWRVYDRGAWHDTWDSLEDAFSDALRGAVTRELYAPDGITRLNALKEAAGWWRAYLKACEEVLVQEMTA